MRSDRNSFIFYIARLTKVFLLWAMLLTGIALATRQARGAEISSGGDGTISIGQSSF